MRVDLQRALAEKQNLLAKVRKLMASPGEALSESSSDSSSVDSGELAQFADVTRMKVNSDAQTDPVEIGKAGGE